MRIKRMKRRNSDREEEPATNQLDQKHPQDK